MTQSEFDNLLQTGSFVVDEPKTACFNDDENSALREYSIRYRLFDVFNIKNLKVNVISDQVFLGGKALGFSVNTKGVIIVGSNYILTKSGRIYPMAQSDLQVGDIIVEINDEEIVCVQDILDKLIQYEYGDNFNVSYVREGVKYTTSIKPALDIQSNSYKLGLWLKEDAMGVGTLTYVDMDSNYGALGHAISLDSTGKPLEILGGNIYNCNVVGVKIGSRGQAGQLMGAFNVGDNVIGTIDKNCENGAFGRIDDISTYSEDMTKIAVGGYSTARPGKAKILSCVSGKYVDEYEIEIIKTNYRNENSRSMVIRVTDSELLAKTGGIVQGMSGSPIIQDGKLVGAVTHVFLNDATKGFGLYIDYMMK